jgi:hypothetical protein
MLQTQVKREFTWGGSAMMRLLAIACLVTASARAEPPEAARVRALVEQLAADRFLDRETAESELAKLGDAAALTAVEEAARSSNLERAWRAKRVIERIKQNIDDKEVEALVGDITKIGLKEFVAKMARDEKYATPAQWNCVAKLGDRVRKQADRLGGRTYVRGDIGSGDGVVRRDQPNAAEHNIRLVGEGLKNIISYRECTVLTSKSNISATGFDNCLLLVDGHVEALRMRNCLVICSGNVLATSIHDCMVLSAGNVEAGSVRDCFLHVDGETKAVAAGTNCLLFNSGHAVGFRANDNKTVKSKENPFRLLRFKEATSSDPAARR